MPVSRIWPAGRFSSSPWRRPRKRKARLEPGLPPRRRCATQLTTSRRDRPITRNHRAQPARPTEEDWISCRTCRRLRARGQPCRRCNEPSPPPCRCDALDWREHSEAHRHLLHALLELRYQYGVEDADPWLEKLIEEAWWNHDEGDRPPRSRDWRALPELASHLTDFPALANFLAAENGAQAVFDWAGVPEREADVYMAAANGYTMEAIAHHYDIQRVTAEARFANAEARIRAALEFSVRGMAI